MSELAQDSERHELSDALEKLGREAARLQSLIDTVPSFLWTSFPDGSKEFLNRRWYEYTGLTPEQGKGWGWKVVVHPDDLDRLLREWLALLNDPKPGELETRIRRYDGEYRWFLIRVLPEFDAEGNVVRWLGSDTDIEDRKRAETKLLKDEQELRRITDAIPHTIVVLDPKGNALYANQAMLDYTGLTMQDVLASDFRARTFHPEDLERVGEEREGGFAGGLPFEIELRVLRKDGQYHWLLLRYNPLRDEEERLVRWYATGTDIDDRKLAEDRTRNENVALREDIVRSSMFEEIVGSCEPLRRVLVQVSKVAPTDSTVLVLGETGTGKELIARAIHNRSKRSNRAFIRVNCAAIPQSLIASELFGHEKGSFTGATQRRLGRFESADGGTIFLDEVGDLPPETQVALLRVLQEREFERVGGTQSVSVDVRVIAATNRDLTSAVAEGEFRQDLFYRLNVFPIRLPALRERISDISLLVGYLIDRYAKTLGKKIRNIDKKTIELFHSYDWPGNIRELQNVVERAVILCEGETFFVDETWLTHVTPKLAATTAPLVADLVEHEREILEAALRESEGVVGGPTGAAVKLGIPRQTLESKIRRLGINRLRFKAS
ncbi:MAG: Fis family transcriptional regulator [Acidobacteria bacterium]|nr:MAG: Fis family transcriptional regulator [Acidobacteriota bacterium]